MVSSLVLDVKKPTTLQVPTAKSLISSPPAPAAPAVDHFACYVVKPARNAAPGPWFSFKRTSSTGKAPE